MHLVKSRTYFLILIGLLFASCLTTNIIRHMRISQQGKEFIRAREGVRLTAYWDGIYWAIGYGNTYYENGNPVRQGDVITQSRANSLFDVIVGQFSDNVNKLITANLTQSQHDALVSYAYNRGIGGLKNSTLLRMVNQNPNNPAIRGQFELEWGTNTQYRNGLIKRRRLEAEMYFSEYSAGNKVIDWLKGNYMFLLLLLIIIGLKFNVHTKIKDYVKTT